MAPKRLKQALAVAALTSSIGATLASTALGVVGGSVIQIQSAPWTVFVQQTSGSGRFLCTGSVIDATHVVTAAHCVFDDAGHMAQASQLSVRAGVSNYSAPAATDAEQDRSVSAVRVHPGYTWSETPGPDDVAVLQLSSALDLSGGAVQAVALPSAGMTYPAGAAVGLAGFGRQSPTASSSGPLDWMTATVEQQGACGDLASGLIANNGILVCAVSPTASACNGDSGSGLVTTGGTPVLLGVASAGTLGCNPGSDTIYTYMGAPEILDFVQGNDAPPAAPRPSSTTFLHVTWDAPLVVGNTLSCSTGGWPTPPQVTYSFVNSANGQVLQTGAMATFLLQQSALGATIFCEIAASSAGGTTLEETRPTTAVHAPPKASLKPVAPLTAAPGGVLTVDVTLRSPLGLFGKVQVCVTLPHPVGGRLCHSAENASGSAGTFPFRFSLRLRKTAPHVATHIAIAAVAGLSSVSSTARLRVS